MQAKAQAIADGYPRLMRWLDTVLLDERTDSELILLAMESKQQEFLEDILAEQLLAQQEPGLVEMLERGMLFELPVPLAVLQSICADLVGFDGFVERARALGLLEAGLTDGLVRVPRVLGLVVPSDQSELAADAVPVLYQAWIKDTEFSTEDQRLEIHRLALLANNAEIAVKMAKRLSDSWISRSLYRAARDICEEALQLQQDGKIIYNLSKIYETLGDLTKSLDYCQQSIEIKKEIGDRQGEAASLHQMSIIYQTVGDLPQALQLSQQSIEIKKEIGNRQGEAASLHMMSIIYQTLGDLPQALALSQQSIEIDKEIGDRQGEAASLEQMAAIAYQQGDVALERELRLQAVAIRSMIGDYGGLITTLRNLGTNNEPAALSYLAQSLWFTIRLSPNLEDAITLIEFIYNKISTGDRLESLLGATAIHLCRSYQHPEFAQLIELSSNIIGHAAQQQGIKTQTDYDNWITQNRLNEPDYFLPELLKQLELIIGDNWLFDQAAFLAGDRTVEAGKLVMQRIQTLPELSLNELLAGITEPPEGEVEWGKPMGQEVW